MLAEKDKEKYVVFLAAAEVHNIQELHRKVCYLPNY